MRISELMKNKEQYINETITINGWLRNKRVSKNVSFLMINDGSCFDVLQIVYKDLENQEEINKLLVASAVKITGVVKETNKENQPIEIEAKKIEILAESEEDYPIQPKKHTMEFLRENAHLRARTNTFNAVFKIRSLLSYALHDFFNKEGFVMLHAPILTSSDAEGAGEMFQVTTLELEELNKKEPLNYHDDFFNKKVNLTVSGQLLAEAYALAFGKVYTFGPTFRAEKSNTKKHAAEFWMLEPEIAFASLEDIIELAKNMLIYSIEYVLEHGKKELEFLNSINEIDIIKRLEKIVNADFARVTYTEAVKILEKEVAENKVTFENPVYYGVDLATEHEKYLTDVIYDGPVFVTDYPKEIKAFYMKNNDDGKTVAATDLLVPNIGEMIGGSQREVRYDVLVEKMKEFNLDVEEYDWYLDLRRYGGVDHAGFGLGFERLIMYVTGIENIRDVIPFPRTVKNCDY